MNFLGNMENKREKVQKRGSKEKEEGVKGRREVGRRDRKSRKKKELKILILDYLIDRVGSTENYRGNRKITHCIT